MHTRGPGYEGDDKKQRGLFPRDPHPLCALGLWGDAAAEKTHKCEGEPGDECRNFCHWVHGVNSARTG